MGHRKSHRRFRKNIIGRTINKSMQTVKNTSIKYMPKVKTGLEKVGSNVVKTSKKSVPFLQRMTRKLLSIFNKKK